MPSKIHYLNQLRPKAGQAYASFLEESVVSLDQKTQALISLSNKVVSESMEGFRFYARRAKEFGATPQEIVDAVMLAAPSTALAKVLKALEELEEMGMVAVNADPEQGHWMRLAPLEEIPEGQIGHFEWEGRGLLTWREGEVLKVYDHRCPHQEAILTPNNNPGTVISCRLHKWRFDITTGQCIGPGVKNLTEIPARVVAGIVEVML